MNLYRGQSKKTDLLKPQEIFYKDIERKLKPKNINLTKAVWGTPDKNIALVMAALGGKIAFDMKYNIRERFILLRDPQWEAKLNLDEIVYVYTFPSEKFIKLDDDEYICGEEIVPSKVEEYRVVDALKIHKVYVPTIKTF